MILVMSKQKFIDFEPDSNMAAVSIRNPDDSDWKIPDGYVDSIISYFWDVEREDVCNRISCITDEQGKQLADFIKRTKGMDLVIHCEAGMSRSPGVACAADCIRNFDGNKFNYSISGYDEFVPAPWQHPNLTVYDSVLRGV